MKVLMTEGEVMLLEELRNKPMLVAEVPLPCEELRYYLSGIGLEGNVGKGNDIDVEAVLGLLGLGLLEEGGIGETPSGCLYRCYKLNSRRSSNVVAILA
jgi:hypothetical protein